MFELLVTKKPTNLRNGMLRWAAHVIPYAGMGLAFGTVYSLSREFRGKDDHINMAAASAAASCVIYSKYSAAPAAASFVILGGTATFLKWLKDHDYDYLGTEWRGAPYHKDFGGFNRVVIGPRREVKEPTNY